LLKSFEKIRLTITIKKNNKITISGFFIYKTFDKIGFFLNINEKKNIDNITENKSAIKILIVKESGIKSIIVKTIFS
jgi:hypothetical protein